MKRLLPLGLCLTLLGGCAHDGLQIDRSHPSQNQNSRVQYIVLHYTSTNLANSLHLLTEGDVSAHYLIGAQPPTVYQLVGEDRRAWHAGQSEWQGRTWLNASTIGIELVNEGYRQTGHGLEWEPFDEGQINALIPLLKDLVKRHGLPPGSIIGHSDIAPSARSIRARCSPGSAWPTPAWCPGRTTAPWPRNRCASPPPCPPWTGSRCSWSARAMPCRATASWTKPPATSSPPSR